MNEGVYAVAALLSLTNGLAFLLVNPHRPINRVYFAGTVLTALWFFALIMAINIGEATPPHAVNARLLFWLRSSAAISAFLVWHIAVMRATLLDHSATLWPPLKKTWPWLAVSISLAILASSDAFIPSYSTPAIEVRGSGYLAFSLVVVICGLWMMIDSARRTRGLTGVMRLELQFFVFLSVLAGLLMVFTNTITYTVPGFAWMRRLSPIWILLWQAFIVLAVCYHRVFDAKEVMLRVGQRLLYLCMLAGGALAAAKHFSPVLGEGPAIFVASIAACTLAIVCEPPLRRRLGLDSQSALAGQRKQIISWTREGLNEDELRNRMEELLRAWCRTEQVTLITPHEVARIGTLPLPENLTGLDAITKSGWITPETLQRQRRSNDTQACHRFLTDNNLGALLSVPRGSSNPSLIVALGRKQSQRPYTYPDVQLLLELAELMDNILTHSRSASRMAQIERMESAAMISRGLAHDLNNLATPVSAFLLHIESRITPRTVEADVLADAKHSIKVMQDYIRESLFFARRLVPEFRLISSAELLSSTAKVSQSRAQDRGVTIAIEPGPDIPFTADRILMQRLMQNLVFNGIDATPKGGRVALSVRRHEEDRVSLSVADQGPGVPEAIRNRIFEPYFTTKDTGHAIRGMGLGLAICLKIGDLHGGVFSVDQTSSGGAVFTISLPLTPTPPTLPSHEFPDLGNDHPRHPDR